jgi:hypothetical protein
MLLKIRIKDSYKFPSIFIIHYFFKKSKIYDFMYCWNEFDVIKTVAFEICYLMMKLFSNVVLIQELIEISINANMICGFFSIEWNEIF